MVRDWFYNKLSNEELFGIFERFCLAQFGQILPVGGTGRCSVAAALETYDVPFTMAKHDEFSTKLRARFLDDHSWTNGRCVVA